MTARDAWRWTDERGVQRLVGTDELRAALASAILPATTLVWREGMKEWAPASTVPELASAAFAGADSPDKRDTSFDPRNTMERQRRATLVGLPTAAEVLGEGNVPVAVPSPGDRGDRPPVTQVPPFGGPSPEAAAVPPPPRVPAPPRAPPTPALLGDKAKPKRRITTNEVDVGWASTTHSDEDDTIPRRARPSELAAAAAAAADATAALRDGRARPDGKKPGAPPARKPPPPLPGAAKDAAAQPPPHKPPSKSMPPPLPPRAGAAGGLLAPVAPLAIPAIGEASKPAVRIRPPTPSSVSIEDLAAEAKAAPFKMGGHGGPALATTLTGVAPVPSGETPRPPALPVTATPVPPETAKAPAEKHPPARPAHSRPSPPETPKPPALALASRPADATKITKTLVSPRDSIDSIPGLAEAIAIADEPSDTAVIDRTNGAAAQTPFGDDEITRAGPHPANGAPAGSNGHAAEPFHDVKTEPRAAAEPRPPARASQSSRPPPLPPTRHKPAPAAHPQQEPPTAPFPTEKLTFAAVAGDLAAPEQAAPSHPPPAPEPDAAPSFAAQAATMDEPGRALQPPPILPPAESPESAGPSAPTVPISLPPPPGDLRASLRPPSRLDEQVAVPLSSLVGAGALLIGLVIGAFFVGRASQVSTARLTAHPALAAVPVVARSALPPPPKPCWMVKQPARWAPQASRSIPFDAVATRTGTLAIGYAQDTQQAMGIEVDLGSGEIRSRLDDNGHEEIERIVPTPAVEFRVARAGTGGSLRSPIEVPLATSGGASAFFAVGQGEGGVALASPPEGPPAALWPLEGSEALGAASVRPAGPRGFALVYRRGGAVWGGFIGADRKASGQLVQVAGSGGQVGKPATAWNGREVAVIFADRPGADSHYEIRVGHAAPGGIPAVTTVLPLPRGGPGGDAFAPDIAGLSDGRWLLMWTEGASGARAVRAQTLTPDFRPLGDPIALSPPAGNFGQGVIGVVGDRAATVFLSKGSQHYELWGAVLQCGG